MPSDFATLVTISFAGSVAAFALFALAFGAIRGGVTAGRPGAPRLYLAPPLLVRSQLPIP